MPRAARAHGGRTPSVGRRDATAQAGRAGRRHIRGAVCVALESSRLDVVETLRISYDTKVAGEGNALPRHRATLDPVAEFARIPLLAGGILANSATGAL